MWEIFLAGGPVMWPLLICSLLVCSVVLERAWFWRHFNQESDREIIEKLLEDFRTNGPDWQPTPPSPAPVPGAVLRMLLSGIAHRHFSMARAMEAEALDEVQRMQRGMGILDTMITAAPMLGILGTVIGIITSFELLAQAGAGEPQAVIGGIARL